MAGLQHPSSLTCEPILSLASTAPVHSAVTEYLVWPPLPHFSQVWTNTLSGCSCPNSLSCELVPSLASIAPVHSAVTEYPVWPPLPQFTQLWLNTLSGLQYPSSLSCEPVPCLASTARVSFSPLKMENSCLRSRGQYCSGQHTHHTHLLLFYNISFIIMTTTMNVWTECLKSDQSWFLFESAASG